jgi:hypothetical protein
MIEQIKRSLTTAESHDLANRLAQARRESRMALVKTGASSATICAVLAMVTLLASTAPGWIVWLFWLGLSVVFMLWIGMPWRRLMRQQTVALDDALRANQAIVTRLQSTRVVEFEEEEDEGACYGFEHAPNIWIFVVGQDFYEDDDFPNSDFSIVDVLGASGQTVTSLLIKSGRKLVPARVIPAAAKRQLEIPEHLKEVHASIEAIESALGGAPDAR